MIDSADRFSIVVEPLGREFTAAAGETLMHAAEQAGLRWPTVCRGNAQCGTCYAQIVSGGDRSPEPAAAELAALRFVPRGILDRGVVRLACQLRVMGDLKVIRRGVRAPEE